MSEVATIRIEHIYAICQGLNGTRAAVQVANQLSRALGAPLTVVDFDGQPTRQADEFTDWLHRNDITARVRVFVSRRWRRVFGMAFRPHSLIVMGGRRRWWPTRSARMRRALEAAGHFVVFVDEAAHAA